MEKKKNMSKIETYQLFARYGYFYYPYNNRSYYYEIFYMLKRVVYMTYNIFLIPLLTIQTRFEENIIAFINLEIILIWIFFLIHIFKKPFRAELSAINSLETRSSNYINFILPICTVLQRRWNKIWTWLFRPSVKHSLICINIFNQFYFLSSHFEHDLRERKV